MTQNIQQSFSRGCPCVHVDGDIAVQEEQTVLCPEAGSINFVKSLGEPSKVSLDDSILSETHKNGQRMAQSASSGKDQSQSYLQRWKKERMELLEKRKEVWQGIGRKQGVKIATLNLRGRNSKFKKSKWPMLSTIMRKERIAIMALQETHLDAIETSKLENACPKIMILSNGDSTSKEGVAFALNLDLVKNMMWNHEVLISNRASRLTMKVEEERGLDIIVLYAPNADVEKKEFFMNLNDKFKKIKNLNEVVILGDFNSVEQQLDRFPHRPDDINVVKKWLKIKSRHKLVDGWREQNECNKMYTYTQPATLSMSRIDRIYLDTRIYLYAYKWSVIGSAKLSDHSIASVEILKKELPYIGEGVWRMYDEDIEDNAIFNKTISLLVRAQQLMTTLKNSKEAGIQQVWINTKEKIKETVIRENRAKRMNLQKEKTKLISKVAKKLEKLWMATVNHKEKYKEKLMKAQDELSTRTHDDIRRLQLAKKSKIQAER